jgi:hypothetical protein
MTISLDEFVNEVNGGPPVGGPPGLKGQCVALVDLYAQKVIGDQEAEPFPENAIDIFGQRSAPGGYHWIKNDPSNPNQVPSRGMIVVFGPDPNTGVGTLGHVDIVLDPDPANHFYNGLDQNWPVGAGPRIVHHPYTASIIGWGYPQSWDAPPPPPPPVEPPEDEPQVTPEPMYIFEFEVEPDDPLRPIAGAMTLTSAIQAAKTYIAAHPGSTVEITTEVT